MPSLIVNTTIAATILWIVTFIYRLLFRHPLSWVPGPKLAVVSNWWHAYHARNGRMLELGRKLHGEYGPVVRVGQNEIWVNSMEGFKHIYRAGSGYEKSDFYIATLLSSPKVDWAFGLHFTDTLDLLSERDPKRYRLQRRLIGPVYQTSSLKKYETEVDAVLKRYISQLQAMQGTEIDLKEWMHILAVECLGAIVLSWSPGYLRDKMDHGSSDHGYMHWRRRSVFGLFPLAAKVDSFAPKCGRLFANMWGLSYKTPKNFKPFFPGVRRKVKSTIDAALGSNRRAPKDDRENLLNDLIQLHKDKPEFKEIYLRRMAVTNFGAGHETLCSALTAIMAMIGSHDNVQKRIFEDVSQTDEDDISSLDWVTTNLRYTCAAIKEAMRLYPVIGMSLSRKVPAEGVHMHGHYFPPGTTIGCNPISLHRNEEIFGPKPDKYNPDRWLLNNNNENNAKIMERCNLIYGGGARTCPGRHLAELIVYKAVPILVREFDIQVSIPPLDEVKYYFLGMLTGVKVQFHPRKSVDHISLK